MDTDEKMDDAPSTNGHVDPGVSIRFGPVQSQDKMDDAGSDVNGDSTHKRKTRESISKKSYAEPESSEEDEPLVRNALQYPFFVPCFATLTVIAAFPCLVFRGLTCPTEQTSSHLCET